LDERGQRIQLPSGEYKSRKIPAVDWNDQAKAEEWRAAWAETAIWRSWDTRRGSIIGVTSGRDWIFFRPCI
jgi:hypothetical protein